jgi:hypothetical protein
MKTNLNLALTTWVLSGFLYMGASHNRGTTTTHVSALAEVQKVPAIHLPTTFYFQLFVSLCTGKHIDLSVVGTQEQVFHFENQLKPTK